jgi:hypothetical protein
MLDAQVVEGADKASEWSGQLEVPITSSVTAATGVVLPLGDIADPGVAANSLKNQGISFDCVDKYL